ncbi:MAG: DUF4388 domain-containing protein [Planctomycetota bacterium]
MGNAVSERTIALVVEQPGNCKLLKTGDRWLVAGREISAAGNARLCGNGVCALFPKLQQVLDMLQTLAPEAGLLKNSLSCDTPGCGALFRMELSKAQDQPVGVTISQRVRQAAALSQKSAPFLWRVPGMAGELVRAGKKTRYEDGQVILAQGVLGQHLYIVAEGAVDVARRSEGNEETVLVTLGRGDCFGEMSILTGELTSAAVRSHGNSAILAIRKDELEALLGRQPLLAREFSRLLAERLKATNASLQSELSRGIIGKLSMISLVDLVQTFSQSRRTGTLVLNYQGEQGRLGFREGTLCTAQAGKLLGDEAFFKTVSWPDAAFCFEPDAPAAGAPGKVSSDTMSLLMEAVRRLDEGRAR